METITFTGTKKELEQGRKTFLNGLKVKFKQTQSCFYCNCLENPHCGCSCHRVK